MLTIYKKLCASLIKGYQNYVKVYRIWIWAAQGSDQVQVYKDCPNCLIFVPITVGCEKIFYL